MSDPIYGLPDLIGRFLLISMIYVIPLGLIFLLCKKISQTDPSPYSAKAFQALCIPGLSYALLESIYDRQGLNFIITVGFMVIAAIMAILFIKGLKRDTWIWNGCALAVLLWWMVPYSQLRLF